MSGVVTVQAALLFVARQASSLRRVLNTTHSSAFERLDKNHLKSLLCE